MIYRRMGKTQIQVSLLSLGSGGYNAFGQRKGVPESEIHRLIRRALDLGINHFDTAARPSYLDSELILGRGLKDVPRDRYTLSTKFPVIDPHSGEVATAERVLLYVEDSLRYLQVDELDILLLGGAGSATDYPRVMEQLRPTFERLLREGKVRHLGSSENSSLDGGHSWLNRAVEDDIIEVVMVAYNMMNQSAEKTVFPACLEKGVGAMGIYTVRNAFGAPGRLPEVVAELVEKGLIAADDVAADDPLGWLLDDDEPSLITAAYRFSAANNAISTVMTGTIDIAHLEANVQTLEKPPLPAEKQERLRELFGHLSVPIGN